MEWANESLLNQSRSHDQFRRQAYIHMHIKNLKKSFSLETIIWADDPESWYATSDTQAIPSLFK